MSDPIKGEPLVAADAPPRARQTVYPEPLASRTKGRLKRPLGDPFGLTNFGVNLTRLAPGAWTALRHTHSRQDEFVYVLEGRPTLITGLGPRELAPGMCVGFKAGDGNAHHLANRSDADVVLLEVGDRTAGDDVEYPDDDIRVVIDPDGGLKFVHKDGTPFER
jgi:uncharacterized cupin superfamily protein